MADHEAAKSAERSAWPIKAIVVLGLVLGVVALAAVNGHRVEVRPFGLIRLNQLMAVPLVVGLIIGWMVHARVAGWAARRSARRAESKQQSQ